MPKKKTAKVALLLNSISMQGILERVISINIHGVPASELRIVTKLDLYIMFNIIPLFPENMQKK